MKRVLWYFEEGGALHLKTPYLLLDVFALFDSLLNNKVLLFGKLDAIVSLVPLSKRGSINLDDGIFYEGFGAHQFVVGSVVNHVHNTGFLGAACKKIHDQNTGITPHDMLCMN